MKKMYVLAAISLSIVVAASTAFCGGSRGGSYDFSPEQRLSERYAADSVFGSMNGSAPAYKVSDDLATPLGAASKFGICTALSVPVLNVDSRLNLMSTSSTLGHARIKYFLEEMAKDTQSLTNSVALSPIRTAFYSDTQTLPSFLSVAIRQLSTVADSEFSVKFLCSAILPTSSEVSFSSAEASSFYYELATFLYNAERYDIAMDAIVRALIYEESMAYYELAQVIAYRDGNSDRRTEFQTMQIDYVYRTQGPTAAFEILSSALRRAPGNKVLRDQATKLLLKIDPERAKKIATTLD